MYLIYIRVYIYTVHVMKDVCWSIKFCKDINSCMWIFFVLKWHPHGPVGKPLVVDLLLVGLNLFFSNSKSNTRVFQKYLYEYVSENLTSNWKVTRYSYWSYMYIQSHFDHWFVWRDVIIFSRQPEAFGPHCTCCSGKTFFSPRTHSWSVHFLNKGVKYS